MYFVVSIKLHSFLYKDLNTFFSFFFSLSGALEKAFHIMDSEIASERQRLIITGGCTACVAVFLLGKLYVANAGDSRATLCLDSQARAMSNDFTPESESYRLTFVYLYIPYIYTLMVLRI